MIIVRRPKADMNKIWEKKNHTKTYEIVLFLMSFPTNNGELYISS